MSNIKIRKGVFETKLEMEHAGIKAGFPSPADDYIHDTLDFNRDYIRHPEASFYGDVEGDSMKDAGIFDGDRVIIDKAVEQFPNQKIAVFSSNYELYGELTSRIVSLIRQEVPAYFRYSIDECFVYLDGMEHLDLKKWGEDLHRNIRQQVGMPVSIGLAPNKTLAKIASHFAKKYQGYRHCCMIDTDEKRIKALRLYPINEVWGPFLLYIPQS